MSVSPVVRALVASSAAAAATWASRQALAQVLGGPRWTRTNHRGAPISLLEGPSVGIGVVAGSLVEGGRVGTAGAIAAGGGLVFGLIDDLAEDTGASRKGLRGHLGAMTRGELTTGGLKVVGISATSLFAAAVALRPRASWASAGEVLLGGALVASFANLANLLDLRPGRALKASALGALPTLAGTGAPVGAAALGAAGAAAGDDLAERDMLGDGGANALGAVVGVAALASAPQPVRALLLAGAVGLTLVSEKISFSDVIGRTPVLRELDAWGRR